MHAELEAVLCSGGLRGKQHTYALLDERAPDARRLTDKEALAELVLRYFTSHGPATVKDLAGWASLTAAQAAQGLDLVSGRLQRLDVNGVAYWFAEPVPDGTPPSPVVHLLQGYDEYVMGYSETRYLLDLAGTARVMTERAVYNLVVLLDTQVAGHWKRTVSKQAVTIQVAHYAPFTGTQVTALRDAAGRHGRFLGLPATVAPPAPIQPAAVPPAPAPGSG
jgi:hypothetical protein